MRVRVIRKLAHQLNGVDLTSLTVGDVVHLPDRDAQMLVLEGWAERVDSQKLAHTPTDRTRSSQVPNRR
jgi:hypothetical protein